MQDYIIMTDSCCDLTDQMARELELEVLPPSMVMVRDPWRWRAGGEESACRMASQTVQLGNRTGL